MGAVAAEKGSLYWKASEAGREWGNSSILQAGGAEASLDEETTEVTLLGTEQDREGWRV